MNFPLFSFSVFLLLRLTIFSSSNYFPLFPSPNISLLYSSCHKSKCHEVQSPMPPFYLADLCSPRIWSIFYFIPISKNKIGSRLDIRTVVTISHQKFRSSLCHGTTRPWKTSMKEKYTPWYIQKMATGERFGVFKV